MKTPAQSELILNEDGSVYHLKLKDQHIADTVLVVGDQNRVNRISSKFDSIEYQIDNREFRTHTGLYKGVRLTVLSTGIGTDNIDIVINELDAAVNINPETRQVNESLRSLNIIRLGTTGGIQPEIPIDSLLISEKAVGLDGLLNFYETSISEEDKAFEEAFYNHVSFISELAKPYIRSASSDLMQKLQGEALTGFTLTAPGFYAPQTRSLRLPLKQANLFDKYQTFEFNGNKVTNFEMETSALYGLGQALGHQCCTICAVIANRANGVFSKDHSAAEEKLIMYVLNKLTV